jgi:hypothetical protein
LLLLLVLLVLLVLLAGAGGCRKKTAPPPVTGGQVTATAAYQTHFGAPPTVEEGSCHAMVGYLPLADDPEKIVPLPLFLFSESNRMALLIERLLTVDPAASERIGASNPFPAGTLLNTLIQDGDLLTVDLGGELTLPGDPARWRQIHAVLDHSLAQFPGVARLRVTVIDQLPCGYPEEGSVPDPAVVASPGEP